MIKNQSAGRPDSAPCCRERTLIASPLATAAVAPMRVPATNKLLERLESALIEGRRGIACFIIGCMRLAPIVMAFVMLAACGGGSGGGGSGGGPGGGGNGSGQSTDASLSALTVSGAELAPRFDPAVTSYTAVVGFLIDSIAVEAATTDAAATLEINGAAPGSGRSVISLSQGDNDAAIEVTAEDGSTTRSYSLTVTRQTAAAFAEDAYIKASNAEGFDLFGWSVALSGDTLAVGAPYEAGNGADGETDNSVGYAGAVYVFTRDGDGVWTQQAYLKAQVPDVEDLFGRSIALAGDTLAVGAFAEDGNGADGETDNSAANAGAVYIFTRDGAGVWSQQAYLKASNTEADEYFGWSVALAGRMLAVGAPREDGNGTDGEADNSAPRAGAVYVYTRDASDAWTQQAYIKPSNAEANDAFGASVALADDTLAVGAYAEDGNGNAGETDNNAADAGAVYIFTRDGAGAWSQQAYLKASNAEAEDYFGWSVALTGETLAVGAYGEDGNGGAGETDNSAADAGAAYVFTRSSTGAWMQQAYLKAANAEADDQFGWSVALSGDTLAAGAYNEDGSGSTGTPDSGSPDSGAVYLFTRDDASGWTQQTYLRASNAGEEDNFGWSVALAGDTLAVGALIEDHAAGAAYTFGGVPSRDPALSSLELDGFALEQIFQPAQSQYSATVGFLATALHLTTPSTNPTTVHVNGMHVDSDGIDLALSEGANVFEIAVTAEDGATTRAYTLTVNRRTASSFAQTAYLKASPAERLDVFGTSVALAGDTLAVGLTGGAGTTQTGEVYVFIRDGAGLWAEQARLTASNADPDDGFGWSVALSGDTLAVGAISEDSNGTDGETDESASGAGAVYVFTRDGAGVWTQEAYLKAANAEARDRFGYAVALEDHTLVAGALYEDGNRTDGETDNSAADSGAVYVFTRNGAGTWTQHAYLKASNADAGDRFGSSVALAGNTLAVGAGGEDGNGTAGETNNGAATAGAVYVFTRDGAGAWTQTAYLKASNAEAGDFFGDSVALARDTLAVGASGEDGNGTGGEMDNSAAAAGAVYVFTRDSPGAWTQEAYLKAENAEGVDYFGSAVALAGGTLAAAARLEDGNSTGGGMDNSAPNAGAVYIFTRADGGVWTQHAYLKASNAGADDEFGWSVALTGDTLAVGARYEESNGTGGAADDSAPDAGAVYAFR
jgi:hypothetical protein